MAASRPGTGGARAVRRAAEAPAGPAGRLIARAAKRVRQAGAAVAQAADQAVGAAVDGVEHPQAIDLREAPAADRAEGDPADSPTDRVHLTPAHLTPQVRSGA